MRKITLAQLRAQNELTQVEAAKKAKITTQTWNNVENGLRKPQTITLAKIAKAFDLKPENIAVGNGEDEVKDELPQRYLDDITGEMEHKPYQKDGFVVNVYGPARFPIIEKRFVYDRRRPVYIRSGVLMKYAVRDFENTSDGISFRDDASIASPHWLDKYVNLVWVNTETGKALYDDEFKINRIDRAVSLWNKKKDKGDESPFSFVNRMVSGFSHWKPVVVSTSLRDNLEAPLALLSLAVKGLPEKDKKLTIEDAIEHLQNGSDAYDYVYESYFVDKDDNVFSDKQIETKNVEDALTIWNDPNAKAKAGYDSFYETYYMTSYDNFKNYRSFKNVYDDNLKADHSQWFNPFRSHTKTYDLYEDWLFGKAQDQGVKIKDLIIDRVNHGYYDGDYLGYYLENGDINVDDLIDVLMTMSNDDKKRLNVLTRLLERLDINYSDLRTIYNSGVISYQQEQALYNATHEKVEQAKREWEEKANN